MTSPSPSPRLAIVNSNEDLLEILRLAFEQEGYKVATTHVYLLRKHLTDLEQFISINNPQVLIWDLAPPYEENWRFFQGVIQLPIMQHRRCILTSTNERRAHEIVGSDTDIFEIVGKPFDLDQLVDIVDRAIKEPL